MKDSYKKKRFIVPVAIVFIIVIASFQITMFPVNAYSPPPSNLSPAIKGLSQSYLSMLGYNITATPQQTVSHNGDDYYLNATYSTLVNGSKPVTATLSSNFNLTYIGVTPDPYLISYNYSGSISTNSSQSYEIHSSLTADEPNANQNSTTQYINITGSETSYMNDSQSFTLANNIPQSSTQNSFFKFTNSSGTFEEYFNDVSSYSPTGAPTSMNGTYYENLYGPIGDYSFKATAQNGQNYTVTVSPPSGPDFPITFKQFTDSHSGSYELLGWYAQWYNTYDALASVIMGIIGFILVFLGVVVGIISWVISAMLAYASCLYANNGYDYLYFEGIVYHYFGWIIWWPVYAEVGWWTNQYLDLNDSPPQWESFGGWYYVPQWHTSLGFNLENWWFPPFTGLHSGVWPPSW